MFLLPFAGCSPASTGKESEPFTASSNIAIKNTQKREGGNLLPQQQLEQILMQIGHPNI